MIDGRKFFYQPIKDDKKLFKNIFKNGTGQGDDYKTVRLVNYLDLKGNYKLISVDLSKQQAIDANPKSKQQTTFTGNLN